MSSALGEAMGFDMELLRRNRFCQGIKRGREYQCGDEANEDAKGKAIELLSEAINRMLRWRVWDPWWIEGHADEWLNVMDRLEVQLRGKYSEKAINTITELVSRIISYNEKFWRFWHDVGGEVKKLLEDLLSGRSEVIIWSNENGISVHGEHVTLEVERTSTGGMIVHLTFEGFKGTTIKVPNIFRMVMSGEDYERFTRILRALEGGIEQTDGFVEDSYAAVKTTQT